MGGGLSPFACQSIACVASGTCFHTHAGCSTQAFQEQIWHCTHLELGLHLVLLTCGKAMMAFRRQD